MIGDLFLYGKEKTGNELVDAVAAWRKGLNFDVDLIPPSWDLHILRKDKIDHDAQRILAFILLWYTPRPIDPTSPRFQGEAASISWKQLENRFRRSRNTVGSVLKRLEEDYGLIDRVSEPRGPGAGGTLDILPVMDEINAITYPVFADPASGKLKKHYHGYPATGTPYFIPSARIPDAFGTYEKSVLLKVLRAPRRDAEPGVGASMLDEDEMYADPSAPPIEHQLPHRQEATYLTQSNDLRHRLTGKADRLAEALWQFFANRLRFLQNTTPDKVHALIREVWHDVLNLHPGDLDASKIRNAYDRLGRRIDRDPALLLILYGIYGASRVTQHKILDTIEAGNDLLDSLGRDALFPDEMLRSPASDPHLEVGLRRALGRHLRIENLHRAVETFFRVRSRKRDELFAFKSLLVRALARRERPFDPFLFADAIVECVATFDPPRSPDDLVSALKARLFDSKNDVPVGTPRNRKDQLVVGFIEEDRQGEFSFVPEDSVIDLGGEHRDYVRLVLPKTVVWPARDEAGQPKAPTLFPPPTADIHLPSHLSEPWGERPPGVQEDQHTVYATIDHIEIIDGDAVATGSDGTTVKLSEAYLRLNALESLYNLANRL